jgi:hypothetical protein
MKLKLAIIITLLTSNSYATCPTKLDGTYSGTTTETNHTTIFDTTSQTDKMVVNQVNHSALIIKIKNNVMTGVKYFHAQPDTKLENRSAGMLGQQRKITFDRTDCTAIDNEHGIFYVIRDNGNTIDGIEGGDDNLSVTTYKYTKQ